MEDTVAALLHEINLALHRSRQRCHCYSQMQTCPHCVKLLALETKIDAELLKPRTA